MAAPKVGGLTTAATAGLEAKAVGTSTEVQSNTHVRLG